MRLKIIHGSIETQNRTIDGTTDRNHSILGSCNQGDFTRKYTKNSKKVREIAEVMNISYGCAFNILHEHLHMEKLLSRWVSRVLTPEQQANCVIASERGLVMYKRNPTEFVSRLVALDKT